jgi:hypothetical protein
MAIAGAAVAPQFLWPVAKSHQCGALVRAAIARIGGFGASEASAMSAGPTSTAICE